MNGMRTTTIDPAEIRALLEAARMRLKPAAHAYLTQWRKDSAAWSLLFGVGT